jgi:hypothetical protein
MPALPCRAQGSLVKYAKCPLQLLLTGEDRSHEYVSMYATPLRSVGFAALFIGTIGVIASASETLRLSGFGFLTVIVQIVAIVLITLPVLALAELITLFVDMARNISKHLDELNEFAKKQAKN